MRDPFQAVLDAELVREARNRRALLGLLVVGFIAAVFVPDGLAAKAFYVLVGCCALLGVLLHTSRDATFHRAWEQASKRVREQNRVHRRSLR